MSVVEENRRDVSEPGTSDADDLSSSRTFVLPMCPSSPSQDLPGVSPKKPPLGLATAWARHANGHVDRGECPLLADHTTKVEVIFPEAAVACMEEPEELCSTPEQRSHDGQSVSGVMEHDRAERAPSDQEAELSALVNERVAAATQIERCWCQLHDCLPPVRDSLVLPEALPWAAAAVSRPFLDTSTESSTSFTLDPSADLQAATLTTVMATRIIQCAWRVHRARRLVSFRRYQQERDDVLRNLQFRQKLDALVPPALPLPTPNLEPPTQQPAANQKYVLSPGSNNTSRKSSIALASARTRQGSVCIELGTGFNPCHTDFAFPEQAPANASRRRPSVLLHQDLQDPWTAPLPALHQPPAVADSLGCRIADHEKNPLKVSAAQRPAAGHVQLVLVGHTEAIRGIDLSPDHTRLATASQDCTVRVWDWPKQRAVVSIKAHHGFALSCAFSPTGALLASGSDDETVRLWDTATGAKLRTLRKHKGAVCSVQWARKEDVLVSASGDGTVRVWTAAKGKKLVTLRGHEDKVTFAVFSGDGEAVASVSADGTIRWWDWHRAKEVMKYREHAGAPTSCQYSSGPQESLLVVGTMDGTVRLFDTRTWLPTVALRDHGAAVTHATFVADTLRVVSSSVDGTVKVWDLRKGQMLLTLHEHSGIVWQCAAWHDHVFSVAEDGRVVCTRLWLP